MAFWSTLVAVFGGFVAARIVAQLTQRWISLRERNKSRDDLRDELYSDAVDLVVENEEAIATRGIDWQNAPVELQKKRLRISHRMKLLAPQSVHELFKEYSNLVSLETTYPIEYRPSDPDAVSRARDLFLDAMGCEMKLR